MTQPAEDGALLPARAALGDAIHREHVLYRFYDTDNRLLYIGMTSHFQHRYGSHRSSTPWFNEVAKCTKEYLPTRFDLQNAERLAIQTENSKYNVVHAPAAPEPKRHPERSHWRDANAFGRTDGIACDAPLPDGREERLRELEELAANPPQVLDDRCPHCYSMYMIQRPNLIKCLYCYSVWTPEEFASDLEMRESS